MKPTAVRVALLAGLATLGSPAQGSDCTLCDELHAKNAAMIGKTIWIGPLHRDIVGLCSAPVIQDAVRSAMESPCKGSVGRGEFRIEAMTRAADGNDWFRVSLPDGARGYVRGSDSTYFSLRNEDKIRRQKADACQRKGLPTLGMTADQVRSGCWGQPIEVQRSTTGKATYEAFIYSRGRSVILVNGKVRIVNSTE